MTIGTTFRSGLEVAGRYRLLERLGEGTSAWVWAAEDRTLARAVALKLMKPGVTGQRKARRRFLREARAVSAIAHPNVVKIHDVLELEGTAALVMERLCGETLGARLAREIRLDVHTACVILLQAIEGVRAAHTRGVLHRDLKPDNLFLCSSAHGVSVRVLDFGLAKLVAATLLDSHSGELTDSGALLGTPYYMSPEQVFGEKDVDERADVWSLGVILYQALSGHRPTEAANVGQILKRVMQNDIVPLSTVAPDLPAPLARLVTRMLCTDRNERPTLARVAAELEALCHEKSEHSTRLERAIATGWAGARKPPRVARATPGAVATALLLATASVVSSIVDVSARSSPAPRAGGSAHAPVVVAAERPAPAGHARMPDVAAHADPRAKAPTEATTELAAAAPKRRPDAPPVSPKKPVLKQAAPQAALFDDPM